jgi:hypothetical protein
MLRIPLPIRDAALLLTPRWGEFSLPLQVLLLLLCFAPVVLIVWLYRYELRLVSRATAVGLLLLRLVAVFLLLFLITVQPILGRTTITELPGRVLVAVDRSDSMDVTDPQRAALDKLRLARVLKLLDPAGEEKRRVDDWIKQYEEKGGPQWIADDELANEPEKRREVANARQMLHEQICQRVDALTRTQIAKRLLTPDGVRLLATVAGKHKVEVLGFAQDAWDAKPDQLEELFKQLRDNDPAKKTTSSAYTDLRLPLEQALKRSGHDEGKILGVVLLTDGQHNWGPSPVKKAIELGEHQLPVYPVALGARQAPPDIALVSVKAPPTVFKDVDAVIEARFKVSGLPAQEVVVELQRPGQLPLEERFRHDGTDRYHTVRFQTRLDQVGTQSLTVAARPVAGETRTDNNGRPVSINVADDKARVLLIDGEARWEYHYLANALLRDRTMQVQSVVFAQPRLGKISEEDLKKVGNPALQLPAEPDAFSSLDCIILGDTTPEQLPLAERIRLEKYVADRGGTLVVLAGKRSMPLAFLDKEKGGGEEDPLVKLLPIEQPRVVNPVAGFPISLTQEGKLTPFLQMDPEAEQSEARWAELPRHFWGVIGKAKPGATTLAYFQDDEEAPKKASQREKEQALIVRQNYGFGRVLYVGLDSTWRWRYKVGDTYHHRFWGQAIRWAASDKPLVAGNEFLRFGTQEPVYRQGQEVDVIVRLAEEAGNLAPDAVAGARLLRPNGEAAALVPLKRRESQPRVLEGKVRDLPPGQYAIELAIPELADKLRGPPGPDGQPGKLQAGFTVLPPDGEEMVELATNWPLLEEIAAKSGGKVFTPENATDLMELLKKQAVQHAEHSEFRLWQWWGTLVVFLVLLTLEWVARKWAGLP